MRLLVRIGTVLLVLALAALAAPTAEAYHFYGSGWRDRHVNYPSVPSGYDAIVRVFGSPCNHAVNNRYTAWIAQDDGRSYPVYYHAKLGGYGPHYGGLGTTTDSSNLNNDVRGHIRNNHAYVHVKRGIWGYVCRRIAGSTKWSTHAWGIAVDINSAYEHVGHYHCHSIPAAISDVWKGHKWHHGVSFGDCMHFQYATNY